MSSTQPATETELKEYCLRRLGKPVIEVNLADEQQDDLFDEALQIFQEYHYDGSTQTYLPKEITASTQKLASAPTGTFSKNESITGGTSGLKANFHDYHSANTTIRYYSPEKKNSSNAIAIGDGNTYFKDVTTTWTAGETITGGTSGATAAVHASTTQSLGAIDTHYISLDEKYAGVSGILPFSANYVGSGMFSVKYQFALNELYRLGTDMKNWVFAQQHLRMIDELFSGKPQFRFNKHLDRLHLDIDWEQDVDIDDLVIIRAHEVLDVTSFTDGYNDEFLKKYLVSLFKKQWGQNLMKFEGIQMPGGVTLNGRQLYDDAREELTQLTEELYTRYSGPDQFIVG